MRNGQGESESQGLFRPPPGPTVQRYLLEFCNFLRIRTGFRATHFRAPTELQRTFERMERARLPLSMWQAFMNATMRFIATSNLKTTKSNIVETIIKIVSVIADYVMEYILLRAVLWILAYFATKELSIVIIFVYYCVLYAAKKIWPLVEKQLQKYATFAMDKLFRNSASKFTAIEN